MIYWKEREHVKTWMKVAAITTVVAIPAFFLGPILFPPADIGATPTAAQIPFFLFLSVTDAILLGLGVSFLLFGLPVLRRVSPDSRARAWAMYLAIGYLMVSWWPHLNMHGSNGFNLGGLLVIDYLFHLPLEIAGGVLAYGFLSLLLEWRGARPAPGPAARPSVKVEALSAD